MEHSVLKQRMVNIFPLLLFFVIGQVLMKHPVLKQLMVNIIAPLPFFCI
jgi:hypothetical protein